MLSTWDRYPAAAGRWLRDTAKRRGAPMGDFLASIDWMIYLAAAGLAASLIAIVLD